MAQQPQQTQLLPIYFKPGIQRDGTEFDSESYVDGQWVRFQRSRPKKMGGYRQIVSNAQGPIRDILVWTREGLNAVYSFSASKIEMVLVDGNCVGNDLIDRTPSGFTYHPNHIWSVTTLFDAAAGSEKTLILAHASNSLAFIDDNTVSPVYYGDAAGSAPFASTGISVSGGVFATGPYAIYYGSDGEVTWSNINEPFNVTTGDAGTSRVTGAKVVKGLPVRSSSGPGGLLWSLDSLIRLDYVGGTAVFKFTTVSDQSSILSQNSVIEYDGAFFWVGVDRFLFYDGASVQELPNDINLNWFFDNLNYAQRQKIWASKTPRFGEIEWFYPRGDATECTHSIIYNIREKTWYDRELPRSSGYYSQVLRLPVLSSSLLEEVDVFEVTMSVDEFTLGDTITSANASGTVVKIEGTGPFVISCRVISGAFTTTDTVENANGAEGTITSDVTQSSLTSLYAHETGWDAIEGDQALAIPAFIKTGDVGYTSGGPQTDVTTLGLNNWMYISRIEPDMLQSGDITLTIEGKKYPKSGTTESTVYTITETTDKIDMRVNYREVYLRFESNTAGGFFEFGRVVIHAMPSDDRS